MNTKNIDELKIKDIIVELSNGSLREFTKNHYSNQYEVRRLLFNKDIDIKHLKSRITPEQLKLLRGLGLSFNGISRMLKDTIAPATLKKISYQQGIDKISFDEQKRIHSQLQNCIDFLRIQGFNRDDIAFIFCTSPEKLKKQYDLVYPVPSIHEDTLAKKLLYRKLYQTGQLHNFLFQ